MAIRDNLIYNQLDAKDITFNTPLREIEGQVDFAIIKIPKSVDLFELYLNQLMPKLKEGSIVVAGFMTRYFSRQALGIAEKYFEEVEQTKAHKKARLMILKSPKKVKQHELVHEIQLNNETSLKQYYGVFSAQKIDLATQFLLKHLIVSTHHQKILDLGCGNGVLAQRARQLNPSSEIYLTDDNLLALESAKLNLGSSPKFHYYFTNHLKEFDDQFFDLVISNPPFHFEYENNIEITLSLFKEVERVLKPGAEFVLVANKHLNYKTHLASIFSSVETIAQNNKYIVYQAFATN
jgi:23S rRNA (guanine1835-N2)-methyltransferase